MGQKLTVETMQAGGNEQLLRAKHRLTPAEKLAILAMRGEYGTEETEEATLIYE